MKKTWIALTGLSALLLSSAAIAQSANTSIPKARLSSDRTQLQLRWDGQRYAIDAEDISAQVLDAVDCNTAQIRDRQTLTGKWFFPESVSVDPVTGNVAVGVLLQECLATQTSAVVVIDPQPGSYRTYTVRVPGARTLPDASSTFPLNGITATGFVGRDLAVRHGDASGSEAMLVFKNGTTPASMYAGCLYTVDGEGDRLCPPPGL